MADAEDEVLGTDFELDDSALADINEEEILTEDNPNTSQESAVESTSKETPASSGRRSATPIEDESREDLDYDEDRPPSTSRPDEGSDDEDAAARKSARSKFSSERGGAGRRSGPPFPDSLDKVRVGGGFRGGGGRGNFRGRGRGGGSTVLLNPYYQGVVPANPQFGLQIRPGVMHLGVVKLGGAPPPRPFVPAQPLIPTNPRDMLIRPGTSSGGPPPPPLSGSSDSWLRLTEEFLSKGNVGRAGFGPEKRERRRSGSPRRRRRDPSPRRGNGAVKRRGSTSPVAEVTKKTAEELGLGEEYLQRLAEQKRIAEEFRRTKEAKRNAEVRQKQRETGKESNGAHASPSRRRPAPERIPTSRQRSRSPAARRGDARRVLESPGRKRPPPKDLSRSPSPVKAAASGRLPMSQRAEFGRRQGSQSPRRRRESPIRKRRRRSSRRSRSPRRRRRRSTSSSRSSSSNSSLEGPPPPFAPQPHALQPCGVPGYPPSAFGAAPLNPHAVPFRPQYFPGAPGSLPVPMQQRAPMGFPPRPIMSYPPQQPPPQPYGYPQHPVGLVKTTPIRPLSLSERLGGAPRPQLLPGAMTALVRGLNPLTTPQRVGLIAATIAPVQTVIQLEPCVMAVQFANPADAGRYAQNYHGRKLDNAVLSVTLQTAR